VAKIGIGDGEASERFMSNNMINFEGSEHTRLRRLMSQPFTPGRIRELEQRTAALVDDLLDPLGDEFDVVADLADVLPVLVICELLGLPTEDRLLVRPWAAAIAEASMMFPPPDVQAANEAALQSFCDYFSDMLSGRRSYSHDGLFAALVAAEEDGERLSHEELIVNSTLLFFAGFETTTNLIGNGMLALLQNPDQLARLRADRSLVPTAVEEMLRYDPPLQSTFRMTHQPIDVVGGTIKANRVISLSFAAANRDPRAFADPDRFDVGRADNHHLGFGNGTHFCLGAHLARLETKLAFDALVARYASIEFAGPVVRKPAGGIRGLGSLPVHVTLG
jgi:cytochrome P450